MKTVSIVFALLLTTTTAAQLPPPPAAELAKFDVTLGSWKGAGISRMAADEEAMKWNSVATYAKILDGYAVQEDVRVDIPELGTLVFRTIYTWDAHAQRFAYFAVGNMGYGGYGNTYWTNDGKLVGSNTLVESSDVICERFVSDWNTDSFKMRVDRSTNGGDFFRFVEGTYTRVDKSFNAADADESLAVAPAPEQLKKLNDQLGKWRLQGRFSPMPGVPMTPISGTNHTRSVLGGHAHFTEITGDDAEPKAYRGHTYLVWDQAANAYKAFAVDNFGGAGLDEGHLQDDNTIAYASTFVLWGVPQSARTVVRWDPETREIKIKSHRLAATHEPDVAFEATSTPITE